MPIDRKRWTLLLLFVLFLAPVVVAILMHSNWWDFEPRQTRNHGTLIEPAMELPEPLAAALRESGAAGMWTLLLAAPEGCEAECRQRLHWLGAAVSCWSWRQKHARGWPILSTRKVL